MCEPMYLHQAQEYNSKSSKSLNSTFKSTDSTVKDAVIKVAFGKQLK